MNASSKSVFSSCNPISPLLPGSIMPGVFSTVMPYLGRKPLQAQAHFPGHAMREADANPGGDEVAAARGDDDQFCRG